MSVPASQDRMSTGQLVIRPKARQYKGWLKATPVFMIILVPLFYGLASGSGGLLGPAALLVLCVLAAVIPLGATYLYIRRAHVVVTPAEIGKAGFTGRPTTHPRSDAATVITATMHYPMDPRQFRSLIVLDRAGRRIMRLRSMYWAVEDMERIVESLGIAPVSPDGVITGARLAKKYPNAVRGMERRPYLYAGLIVLSPIIVAFVGTVVFMIINALD